MTSWTSSLRPASCLSKICQHSTWAAWLCVGLWCSITFCLHCNCQCHQNPHNLFCTPAAAVWCTSELRSSSESTRVAWVVIYLEHLQLMHHEPGKANLLEMRNRVVMSWSSCLMLLVEFELGWAAGHDFVRFDKTRTLTNRNSMLTDSSAGECQLMLAKFLPLAFRHQQKCCVRQPKARTWQV